MTDFIHDNFLLDTETSQRLYHDYACDQPIIDYHCHLSPEELSANRRYDNLFDIWLAGDHYKWRAMRLNGEPEHLCTGDGEPYEKFLAFARTVPRTIRNPLFHWTHLELKRYFGIHQLLTPESAPAIWEEANKQLATDDFQMWSVLDKFRVKMIGTTDDPTSSLESHRALAQSDCPAKVLPSFRPDPAFGVSKTDVWNDWLESLASASGTACGTLGQLLEALQERINAFAAVGCLASDHGLESCPNQIATDAEAEAIFAKGRAGQAVSGDEEAAFTGYLLCWLGERYAEKNWVMQFHVGAIRNVNRGLFQKLGADIGCDSIHDRDQIEGLATVLGELSGRNALPRVVLYNLDPAKNYAFATMCGNFFEEGVPGKIQFGSGWWFLDQLEGMTWQMNTLSQLGLLSNFIGMLTDSRSLMSYPRHEYFRRLLCRLIGADMENGLIPNDMDWMGQVVSDISYGNAKRFFGL